MEVNAYQQLFGYQHSLKYLILCSAEERNSSCWLKFHEVVFFFYIPLFYMDTYRAKGTLCFNTIFVFECNI